MKILFGKYWWLIPVVIAIILALAMVVQYTKDINDVAKWVFSFLKDWAVILSASIAVIAVIAVFMGIRENRRAQALGRIRTWAENILTLLAGSGTIKEKNRKLQDLWLGSFSISADARLVGGNLKIRTGETIDKFNKFHTIMEDKDTREVNKEFLTSLMDSLYDMIESASGL